MFSRKFPALATNFSQLPLYRRNAQRSDVVSEHFISVHCISSARQPFPPPFLEGRAKEK